MVVKQPAVVVGCFIWEISAKGSVADVEQEAMRLLIRKE